MFEGLTSFVRAAVEWLIPQYRNLDFAYAIAAAMLLVATVVTVIAVVGHIFRRTALAKAQHKLTGVITFGSRGAGAPTADDRENAFHSRFGEIDSSLGSGTGGDLTRAWRRYRRTLTFIGAPPVRSSQRPNAFFYAAFPPPTWLGFVANLFVAFGLLATFLGLVAALTFASQGMATDDTTTMQATIRDLLSAAGSKFITSIAGVGLSIVLRLTERAITIDLRARLDSLSTAVEMGVRVDPDAHSAALADRLSSLLERLDHIETKGGA